jgi:hypothetical protein
MTNTEYQRRAEEIDRLLNDPETPMRPDLVWDLVEHLARTTPEVDTFTG